MLDGLRQKAIADAFATDSFLSTCSPSLTPSFELQVLFYHLIELTYQYSIRVARTNETFEINSPETTIQNRMETASPVVIDNSVPTSFANDRG
jgi:hypothetical protein